MPGQLSRDVRDSLYEVLYYLWRDERKDWEARDPSERTGHIFNHLRRVEHWLTDEIYDAEDA